MGPGDNLRRAREVVRELHALRAVLAEHDQVHSGDQTGRVLRQMIADRQRLMNAARI